MRGIIKATVVLGLSSAAGAALGLVTAKASALFLGPEGVGFLGLLQSLLGVAQLLGGIGLSASIVRFGAAQTEDGTNEGILALRSAAWLVVATTSVILIAMLVLFRQRLSLALLGGASHTDAVVTLAIAVPFSLAYVVQIATLNAYHRVKTLATVTLLASMATCAVQVLWFWLYGMPGVPYAITLAAVLQCLISSAAVARYISFPRQRSPRSEVSQIARKLLRFGIPYTVSAFAGSGVQLLLPAAVLASLDLASVGYFRAAFAFAGTYLGIVLASLAQDYYPRISAQLESHRVSETINQQFRLLLLTGGPLVLMAIAFAPTLIRLCYTVSFLPAAFILRWQMLGDVFRFQAWVLSFVILARGKPANYLGIEIVGGLSILGGVLIGAHLIGLKGIGIGYAVGYLLYDIVVWRTVSGFLEFRWERSNLVLMLVLLTLAAAILVLPDLTLKGFSFSVGAVFAFGYSSYSLRHLRREWSAVHVPKVAEIEQALIR